jgi:hypothetical protein
MCEMPGVCIRRPDGRAVRWPVGPSSPREREERFELGHHRAPDPKHTLCPAGTFYDAPKHAGGGLTISDHISSKLFVDALPIALWRRRPPDGTTGAHSHHWSHRRDLSRSGQRAGAAETLCREPAGTRTYSTAQCRPSETSPCPGAMSFAWPTCSARFGVPKWKTALFSPTLARPDRAA